MPSVIGLTKKLVLRILMQIDNQGGSARKSSHYIPITARLTYAFKDENLVKIVQLCATRTEDGVLRDQ